MSYRRFPLDLPAMPFPYVKETSDVIHHFAPVYDIYSWKRTWDAIRRPPEVKR